MGTLSKAVGAYGGYVCASKPVIELLRSRAASFVYSTALPPGVTASAITAIDRIAHDKALVNRPLALARRFCERLGLPPAQSAIVPLIMGGVAATSKASRALQDAGFFVAAIRPPTVPSGTARLRITFSAAHSQLQVDELAEAVRELDLAS